MNITDEQIDRLLARLRLRYPAWDGFAYPAFQADEVDYKQATARQAATLISREALIALLDAGAVDEITGRLETIGRATNLLYQSVPMAGDLNVLYQPELDKPVFCAQILDLLHGDGVGPERLGRYVSYVQEHGLPNKWTFPTYFLFFCHPGTELFVKPRATQRFLKLLGAPFDLGEPGAEAYARLCTLGQALKEAFAAYGVRDMIDVQSVIWVCNQAHEQKKSVLTKVREKEFAALFDAFMQEGYLTTSNGQRHREDYVNARAVAETNYAQIVEAAERGEDVTDAVLTKLLPHQSTEGNRARDAWIHPASTITKDVKSWYERGGLVRPEDWPVVAQAILLFLRRCVEEPEELVAAVEAFVASPYSKGFQAGFLSPILSALRPDVFLVVNSKPKQLINHFAGTSYTTRLADYPAINETGLRLIEAVRSIMHRHEMPAVNDHDLFDIFSHWLVGEKKHRFDAEESLAAPFDELFKDREQAEWAFDFVRKTAERLGIHAPQDERFAFNIPRAHGNTLLRLNFGGWMVFDFDGKHQAVHVPLFTDEAGALSRPSWGNRFARSEDEPEVAIYIVPIGQAQDEDNPLHALHDRTLGFIAEKFGDWTRSNYRNSHVPVLAEATFDEEVRDRLLKEGLEVDVVDPPIQPGYTLSQCAADTGFTEDELERWVRAIERKGQAIFYGPPGTGKTHLVRHLARYLVDGGDGRIETIQFHPAYTYEDFMQGIRPAARPGGGLDYPLVPGRFLTFCRDARTRTGRCVLIVDEINRANLSRVFGELMYLLEYRDQEIALAGGDLFQIPENVRLLGTMNTADRSIALVDHALRRRFAFVALQPRYDILLAYQQRHGFPVDGLIKTLRQLNTQIGDKHYEVGISFFLIPELHEHVEDIWRMEIEPYLEEYFFDQPDKIEAFRWEAVRPTILDA